MADRYWEMRPEDKQTLTQRYAPDLSWLHPMVRDMLTGALQVPLAPAFRGPVMGGGGITPQDFITARQRMRLDEGDPLLFGNESGMRPARLPLSYPEEWLRRGQSPGGKID